MTANKMNNQAVLDTYNDFDNRAEEFLQKLHNEDKDGGYRFDLKETGYAMAILSEATVMLRNAHLMMRATRDSDGKDVEELGRVLYNLARMIDALVMEYIDDCGLDHEVFLKMSEEESKKLTQGDLQDAAAIVDRYFEAYKAVYPGSVTPDTTFVDVLYSSKNKS